jgi:two-component system NtrC family sensor kinase
MEASRPWFLRATINGEQFDSLVRTTNLGATGEAFIVNRTGHYQTTARHGSLLERSPVRTPPGAPELLSAEVAGDEGPEVLRVTRWINQGRWLLVVQQDVSEVRAPVNRAILLGALNAAVAVAVIALAVVAATRHLTNRIDRANREREEAFRAFLRSAKLASIGELATGLAHEINNPLAILSADQTNIDDLAKALDTTQESTQEILRSVSRSKRQIERCKSITTKILQFGRSAEPELVPTRIGPSLKETASLLRRQASVSNVELSVRLEENLPAVLINQVELEQVIVNLVNNALYALSEGGRIDIVARRGGAEVMVEVVDDGPGISPDDLERVFEPFFTTKPPGKGTGLGLSVCYGIVESWGGRIELESTPGRGTTVRIHIPVPGGTDRVESSEGHREQGRE